MISINHTIKVIVQLQPWSTVWPRKQTKIALLSWIPKCLSPPEKTCLKSRSTQIPNCFFHNAVAAVIRITQGIYSENERLHPPQFLSLFLVILTMETWSENKRPPTHTHTPLRDIPQTAQAYQKTESSYLHPCAQCCVEGAVDNPACWCPPPPQTPINCMFAVDHRPQKWRQDVRHVEDIPVSWWNATKWAGGVETPGGGGGGFTAGTNLLHIWRQEMYTHSKIQLKKKNIYTIYIYTFAS